MSNSDRRFGTYVQPCEEAWYIKELKTPPPSLAARLVTSIRTVVKQTDTTKSLCNAGHLFLPRIMNSRAKKEIPTTAGRTIVKTREQGENAGATTLGKSKGCSQTT